LTEVYFIRHAEPDHSIADDGSRPLTAKGKNDALRLVVQFRAVGITRIYSSPYIRAIQTVKPIAADKRLPIEIREDFRERKSNTEWIDDAMDLDTFVRRMWGDPYVAIDGGESVKAVQERNIRTLKSVVRENDHGKVIVGTHGTALATMISYYNSTFTGDDFMKFIGVMPYIVRMNFENDELILMEEVAIQSSEGAVADFIEK